MVQTGVYCGHPNKFIKLPATNFYIYSNPNNPNYPGYTVMKNNNGWVPPDSQYIPIFSRISWVYSRDYRYYHYFFYGGTIEIHYSSPSKYDMWISGSSSDYVNGIADDAILLYCQETNILYSVYTTDIYVTFPPQSISSILHQGKNHVMWFVYSGPQWNPGGCTWYSEESPYCHAYISDTYILPKRR